VIEIDLLGVWRTVRPALPQIVERRGHAVVASVYAFLNGAMATPYAVSKAGVEQLGRALRAELAIHVREIFDGTGVELSFDREFADMRFDSLRETMAEYENEFGPIVMAKAALEPEERRRRRERREPLPG
jgi:short-subunit dehydrogenase